LQSGDSLKLVCQTTFISRCLFLLALGSGTSFGQAVSSEKLRLQTISDVRAKIQPALIQYCKDACMIIDIAPIINENLGESEDLGFEGVVGEDQGELLTVSKVNIQVQVDDRVTAINRERMSSILKNNLLSSSYVAEVVWTPVSLPQIGQTMAKEEQLKQMVQQRISQAIEKVIEAYCPESCVLSQTTVTGKLVTPDESVDIAPEELARDTSGNGILKIDSIEVEVSIDDAVPTDTRNKIVNVMKVKTRFHAPVRLDVLVTSFPESFATKKEKEELTSADPYGLGRLRETLKIFRELAGTKEIITNNSTSDRTAISNSSREESNTSERDQLNSGSASKTEPWEWTLYIAGILLLLGLIAVMIIRFAGANRDAKLMMEAAYAPREQQRVNGASSVNERVVPESHRQDMSMRMRIEDLKNELISIFIDQPKVAKETFSRLLQEEGIEETAKYVHIFGHMVVFELLSDPNLQRDLYELSEYYHKSEFVFSQDDEYKLINSLKTRVTANEIRVLTRKQMDQFDFLSKLDSNQVYNLIAEEKPAVQSIVLTQLDHKRRRAVFEMYQGESKVVLMKELCRADAIPKDYLANVAMVLHKKVTTRPEFDTENIRSSDILFDLLEKANLGEQKALMSNLNATNQDAARAIKLKLVTVEIIPYLKDGHMVEIMLGLEREDVKMFLAGTREHIRNLILSKAPDELAESWVEDLENMAGFDEQGFRLAEMKILSRIRSLVNNGVINLLDLNEMIFVDETDSESVAPGTGAIDKSLVA
jgi:flagellar motor switch protein FliG